MSDFEPELRNYYDIEQLLKQFGIYIYLGKRLWDLEMTGVELQNLHQSGLITDHLYARAKIVLRHEHEEELKRTQKSDKMV
ncbi:YqgQ family protein [Lapidilactobacillus luobeiensis]|uniref:YqgQ family protein n=1 Tax=Lapidilactobacillus luobeiensis TaxID=2950371 RepID=UPI0021C38E80|nr:YqgQ family protein [Lapidilactobacillus luobeiensis]